MSAILACEAYMLDWLHMNATDCIFCKIIAGEIPSHKIYEDEHTFAFLDIKPINPGHALVIPKAHHENIFETTTDTLSHMTRSVQKVAQAIRTGLEADVKLAMNNGVNAGQVVFHAHIHVIPRFDGDGRELWHGSAVGEERLIETAEKIKNALS